MTGTGPAPLLEVERLRLVAAGPEPLVDDLTFDVGRGEVVALLGESGSGKTLAARAILRLLPPGVRQVGGRITLDGEDLASLPPSRLRRLRGAAVGMVFQEPMVSLNPALTVGAQMAEGLRLHTRLTRAEIRERCLAMLRRVQIADPERCLGAFPHEFSGGMRQRIMLASAMLLRPKLLIADEPTTALDTLTQREVLDLLVELTRDHGTAVLLITHNLRLVARYAQRAVVLRRGALVEAGPAAEILSRPRDPYTRQLIEALPRRGPARPLRREEPPVIVAENLSVVFPGRRRFLRTTPGRTAVDRVSLAVYPGEIVAVVGGSGSGKTTLGRAILRLVPASGGTIRFRGEDLLTAGPEAFRRFRLACQMVFQDPYSSLDPRMRIGDIVAAPLRHLPEMSRAARRARVAEVLDEVGLAGFERRYPHELSGGQRQRVAIARAIVRRPAFVVADEPVSALDMTIQQQVLALFTSLQKQYRFACLFISHDLAAVEQIADRVLVMQQGRIVESGTRDEVFDRPQHPYTRALLRAALMTEGPSAAAG
ncbi:MAG TPA: ABC transporter ATP-binding protein [Thermodesulfobacteriota bacterium]